MTDGLDISDIETRAGVSSVTDVDRVVPGSPIASGQTLGRYVVLEQIGRGGIGRVLRAYDSKLEREVALKLLDRSALEERTQARIVHEARTMAKLSHPNVVSVYDVEDTALGVVLVMEYVRGRTLRSWIREETPSWERIVERFHEAGRGLAAAHASEILHLDFKPSNVLIPQTGQAKVADFGIARFVPGLASNGSSVGSEDPVPVSDDMSRQGVVIGTPRYMAPEQHGNEDLHPATDQYGFCVALWEALVGAPPFSAPVARLGAIKREGPPAWPETLAIPRPIVAAILRGLAAEPGERWPTMKALLDVLADDPGRRRRAWLTVVGGIGLLGLGGIASRTWSPPAPEVCTGAPALLEEVWSDGRRDEIEAAVLGTQLPYAEPTGQWLEQTLDDYGEAWVAMHTETCEATTVRGDQSASVMDLRMTCLDRARLALGAVTDVLATADAEVVERAHQVAERLEPLERCADVEVLGADVGAPPPEEAERVGRIEEALALARAQRSAGRFDDAQASLDRATTELASSSYEPIIAELDIERGTLLVEQGKYPAAEQTLLDALQRATRFHRWSLMRKAGLRLMAVVGSHQARPDEAMRYRELVVGLSEGEPRAMVEAHAQVGQLLIAQNDYASGDAELHRALELDDRAESSDQGHRAKIHNNLAVSLYKQGNYAEAVPQMRHSMTLECELRGTEHPECVDARRNLATMLMTQGKYVEAEAEIRSLIALQIEAFGEEHPRLANSRLTLAVGLRRQGRPAEAEEELQKVLAIQVASLGSEHPHVAMTRNNLANTWRDRGRHDKAEHEDRLALELRMKVLPADHPDIPLSRGSLADSLRAQGKHEEAMVEYQASLSGMEKAVGAEHPNTNLIRESLALVLLDLERPEDALVHAEQAHAFTRRDDIDPTDKATATFTLARALWDSERDRSRAVELAQQARVGVGDGMPPLVEEIDTWLREHSNVPRNSP